MYRTAILREILQSRELTILSGDKLSDRIKSLRQSKGLDQEKFAEAAGVHKISVWRWENGHKKPSEASMRKLCNAFGVDISYFEVMN